jgi:hypothetical protein
LNRRGRPLAAVVAIEDIAPLEEIEDREDLKAARAVLRVVKRKGTIPWTRLKKELRIDSLPDIRRGLAAFFAARVRDDREEF